jgi:hypothetical protein
MWRHTASPWQSREVVPYSRISRVLEVSVTRNVNTIDGALEATPELEVMFVSFLCRLAFVSTAMMEVESPGPGKEAWLGLGIAKRSADPFRSLIA